MKYSTQQNAVFDFVENGSGNAVVEAVAGSGKTTTIVEALKYMDGDIFLGAFNNAMAKELQERTSKFPNVKCATFHSLGFSALKSRFRNEDLKVDGRKLYDIFNAADMLPKQYGKLVTKMVSFAKTDGFGLGDGFPNPFTYNNWSNIIEKYGLIQDFPLVEDCDFTEYPNVKLFYSKDKEGGVEQKIHLSCVYECAKEVLKRSTEILSVIDFDDMIYLSLLKNCRFKKYDWFLIDEAQDTSPVRLEMAKRSLNPTSRLVAVGDRNQAIFGFAGAMTSSIQHIQETFKTTNLPLSTCYRCGSSIIKEAQAVNPVIMPRDDAPEGVVRGLGYHQMLETAVGGEVILGRFNAPLIDTAFDLRRNDKIASIKGASPEPLINYIKSFKISRLDKLKMKIRKDLSNQYATFVDMSPTDDYYAVTRGKLDAAIDNAYLTICFYNEAIKQNLGLTHELYPLISSIMTEVADSRAVILSSIHKAKGMEYEKVYILNEKKLGQQIKDDPNHWRNIEEKNLRYVAITRAKKELVYVEMPDQADAMDIWGKYADLVYKGWAEYPRD